jgi:alpha,alpha-trehalase
VNTIDQLLGELFVDLHTSGIWEDEKYISDAELTTSVDKVLALYNEEKSRANFDLKSFFEKHFQPAQAVEVDFAADPNRSPEDHIKALWPYLHRSADPTDILSTKVPLPHSYIVPGGRFQEVYYWDSYFTELGLLAHGHRSWVGDLLDNFAHFIDTYGHIPNGNRTYFLSRSQPPFFALMVDAYAKGAEEPMDVYERYLPALEKEYTFWSTEHRNEDGKTTYWDAGNSPRIEMYRTDLEWEAHAKEHPLFFQHLRAACESGWDFSSRWLADPMDLGTIHTMDIAPVDLNSLLLFLEELLFNLSGNKVYQDAAYERKFKLQTEFFTEEGFQDIDLRIGTGTGAVSAAVFYPLFVGAATTDQAAFTVEHHLPQLLETGGLLTTPINSGQQWDAPNGWAPLQWIAVMGLDRYGFKEEARDLATRWIQTCDIIYNARGKFVEKYNVVEPENLSKGGEYDVQDGFGWSNGVYIAMLEYLKK